MNPPHPFAGHAAYKSTPSVVLAVFMVLGLVPLGLVPLSRAENTAVAETHARRGMAFAHSQDWPKAEQELKQAVVAAPGVAVYRAQLASILGLEGKWDDSLRNFEKAVALDPENINFRRETAAVQWRAGSINAAEKNLRFILQRVPADPGATLLLGLVAEARGNYEYAATLLSSQMGLALAQPDRTVALFTSLIRSGRKADIAKVVDALGSHSNDAQWANATGRCAMVAAKDGDLQTAEALFALIPNDDKPDRRTAGFQLAVLLYRSGQAAQAQQLLLQLLGQGWESADAESLLGNCLQSQHQDGPALQAYSRAIQLDPSKIERYDDLISLQLDVGKANDAIVMARRAIAIAPNNARAWVLKGNVELHLNAYKDAIVSYTRGAQLDSSDPNPVLLIGGVRFIAGENDAAIAEYQTGIERFPNDPRFYIACAQLLLGEDSP
jgi:tetratricopeptide (TPR) repeat protein